MLPALLLVTSGLLFTVFALPQLSNALDFDLFIFRPLVILGGLAVAFGVNMFPLVRGQRVDGSLAGTLRLQGHFVQLTLVVLTGLISAVIFVYLLAENLNVFIRVLE